MKDDFWLNFHKTDREIVIKFNTWDLFNISYYGLHHYKGDGKRVWDLTKDKALVIIGVDLV